MWNCRWRKIVPCLATFFFLFALEHPTEVHGKYVEGHLKTHDVSTSLPTKINYATNKLSRLYPFQDWTFVARFCFLSGRGRYEYLIEYEKRLGTPKLLLYYDDESQWPSVYKTDKSCLQKVDVLNVIDNQIVTLSTKRPESYLSGCRLTTSRERLRPPPPPTSSEATPQGTSTGATASDEEDSSYFEQFLKSTTQSPSTTTTTTNPGTFSDWDTTTTTSITTTGDPFEAIMLQDNATDLSGGAFVPPLFQRRDNDGLQNGNRLENDSSFRADVEELFEAASSTETSDSSVRVRKRRSMPMWSREKTGTIIVSCSNAGGFTTVRERWWYIAISNCGSDKGIDIKYRFRMTNGPPGDFWHEHFSADEMCKWK